MRQSRPDYGLDFLGRVDKTFWDAPSELTPPHLRPHHVRTAKAQHPSTNTSRRIPARPHRDLGRSVHLSSRQIGPFISVVDRSIYLRGRSVHLSLW